MLLSETRDLDRRGSGPLYVFATSSPSTSKTIRRFAPKSCSKNTVLSSSSSSSLSPTSNTNVALPHTKTCTSYLDIGTWRVTIPSRSRPRHDACTTCGIATGSGKALHLVWFSQGSVQRHGIIPLRRYLRSDRDTTECRGRGMYSFFGLEVYNLCCHYIVISCQPVPRCQLTKSSPHLEPTQPVPASKLPPLFHTPPRSPQPTNEPKLPQIAQPPTQQPPRSPPSSSSPPPARASSHPETS